MESYEIARLGLMRTFQLSRELGGLTVLENLLVAPKVQAGESLFNIFFRPRLRQARGAPEHRARHWRYSSPTDSIELRDNRARELSGGQKKLLEIARGVMASPSLLLLDEPMAGVNPALIERIGGYILDLKQQGVTVLMIEHNLNVVETDLRPRDRPGRGPDAGDGSSERTAGEHGSRPGLPRRGDQCRHY